MAVSRSDVLKIAELARLEFSEAELEEFTVQFQRILDYVDKLKEVDVQGIEPTSHVAMVAGTSDCIFRDDVTRPSLPVTEALANAPDPGSDHFRVPKVL